MLKYLDDELNEGTATSAAVDSLDTDSFKSKDNEEELISRKRTCPEESEDDSLLYKRSRKYKKYNTEENA